MSKIQQVSLEHRERCYELAVRPHRFDGFTQKHEDSIRRYFETGDIVKYTLDNLYVDPYIAMFLAPQQDIGHFIERTNIVWSWFIENDDSEGNKNPYHKDSIDKQISAVSSSLFTTGWYILTDEFFFEVFTTLFGKSYKQKVDFPLAFGVDKKVPTCEVTADTFVKYIMRGLIKYLAGREGNGLESYDRYKQLAPFMFSALPYFAEESYETTRFKKRHKINRVLTGWDSNQSALRSFLCTLYGFNTSRYATSEKIQIQDKDFLDYLFSELDKIEMPPKYYVLLDMVKEHGAEAITMSI